MYWTRICRRCLGVGGWCGCLDRRLWFEELFILESGGRSVLAVILAVAFLVVGGFFFSFFSFGLERDEFGGKEMGGIMDSRFQVLCQPQGGRQGVVVVVTGHKLFAPVFLHVFETGLSVLCRNTMVNLEGFSG